MLKGYNYIKVTDSTNESVDVDYLSSTLVSYDRYLSGASELVELVFTYTIDGIYTITFNGIQQSEVMIDVNKASKIVEIENIDEFLNREFKYNYKDVDGSIGDTVSTNEISIYVDSVKDVDKVNVKLFVTNNSKKEYIISGSDFEVFSIDGTEASGGARFIGKTLDVGEIFEFEVKFSYEGDGEYLIIYKKFLSKEIYKINIPVYRENN